MLPLSFKVLRILFARVSFICHCRQPSVDIIKVKMPTGSNPAAWHAELYILAYQLARNAQSFRKVFYPDD